MRWIFIMKVHLNSDLWIKPFIGINFNNTYYCWSKSIETTKTKRTRKWTRVKFSGSENMKWHSSQLIYNSAFKSVGLSSYLCSMILVNLFWQGFKIKKREKISFLFFGNLSSTHTIVLQIHTRNHRWIMEYNRFGATTTTIW